MLLVGLISGLVVLPMGVEAVVITEEDAINVIVDLLDVELDI